MILYRAGIITLLMTALSICGAVRASADVYLNNTPADIEVTEGNPVDIPIFFASGALQGMPAELFIWKDGLVSHQREHYIQRDGQLMWAPDSLPLVSVDSMIEYGYIVWTALSNTTGVESFQITICLDGTVDGVFTAGNSTCGYKVVTIEPAPTAPVCTYTYSAWSACQPDNTQTRTVTTIVPAGCTGTPVLSQSCTYAPSACSVTPEQITQNLKKSIAPQSFPISASCAGQAVEATVQCGSSALACDKWITLSKQAAGTWNANITTVYMTAGTTYGATVTIKKAATGEVVKSIPVSVTLQGTTILDPGANPPPQTCTVSVWPSTITISSLSGETKSSSPVAVSGSCDTSQVVAFTATVTEGSSWLSVSGSSGSFTATASNTGGLSGTYVGTILVTPSISSYPPVTVRVVLTIEGPCTVNSAVVSPSSLTPSVVQGANAASTTLTVKDNCQNNLAYTVQSVSYTGAAAPPVNWVTTSPAAGAVGSGTITVGYEAASLPVGTYGATITVTPQGYSDVQIPVTLSVTSVPTQGGGGDASVLANLSITYFDLGPKPTYKLWKYYALGTNPTANKGLQIGLADMTQYSGFGDSDLIVKYAGDCDSVPAPSLADWERARAYWVQNGNSSYSKTTKTWSPARVDDSLYYKLSQDSFEFVEIPDNRPGCYYIMVLNTLETSESSGPPYYSLRVTVGDLDIVF